MFVFIADMVFHLESGSCESGTDVRTVDRAFDASHFAHHLSSDLLTYRFQCPQEPCGWAFRFLSDVLLHAESQHSEERDCYNNFKDFQGIPSSLEAFLSVLITDVEDPPDEG